MVVYWLGVGLFWLRSLGVSFGGLCMYCLLFKGLLNLRWLVCVADLFCLIVCFNCDWLAFDCLVVLVCLALLDYLCFLSLLALLGGCCFVLFVDFISLTLDISYFCVYTLGG